MMSTSGARGNISQVRQLVAMRGLMADAQGGSAFTHHLSRQSRMESEGHRSINRIHMKRIEKN